ncbi:glutathione-disulfide reductase [Gammaproteobacteria bacterium]|nr:glutathione-disulfide reductase [Gammaproteobacteria bacterium]
MAASIDKDRQVTVQQNSKAIDTLDVLEFDYLVIGGGSGGIASARRAASYGARVAIVEKGALGGTCVNVGCVPKKTMWNAARVREMINLGAAYQQPVDVPPFNWPAFREWRDRYIQRLNGIYENNLQKDEVTVFHGEAVFIEPRTVRVGQQTLRAPQVLIATGGQPVMPNWPGVEHAISSDGFFELDALPPRAVVVGAGYIAVELAGVLGGLGASVDLLIRKQRPLRDFDESLVDVVIEEMGQQNVTLRAQCEVERVEKREDGSLRVHTNHDTHIDTDCVLVAIGRRPLIDSLMLDASGVETNARGYITVDQWQHTSADGVYALGDVTGPIELTPVAIAAGRRLADRLFDGQTEAKMDYEDVASVIFSHPPIGTVGLSERDARERYGDATITVFKSRFTNMLFAPSTHKPATVMKLVCTGDEQRVVGCHIVGEAADEIIQGFAVAVKMGATKADFDRTVAIHPTAAEELVTMR